MREPGSTFTDGVPELVVLRCLRDREMYGYELVQEIRAQAETAVRLGLSEANVKVLQFRALKRAADLESIVNKTT